VCLILSGSWKSSVIKKRRVRGLLLPPYVLLPCLGQRFNNTVKHYQEKGSNIRRHHQDKGFRHKATLSGRVAGYIGIVC